NLAIKALERAIEIAAQHRLNELLITAEASLEELRAGRMIDIQTASKPSSPAVAKVASAVRQMRTLAGIAG
ncbi:MAG: hypothetical protein M3336_16820, partial [Chloroflexota bacterium]|nr:hypothetical protein [Chloroflexota bacterium]